MRCHRALPGCAAVILCVAAAAISAPAQATQEDPAGLPAAETDWQTRDASTSAPLSTFLGVQASALVGGGEPAGIVAVRNAGGQPEILTVPAQSASSLRAAAARLQADPSVVSMSVNHRSRVLAAPYCGDPTTSSAQWDYAALGLSAIHRSGVTGRGTTVAVVDSGVNGNTPELKGQVLSGADFVSGGNGWNDGVGHGTHVAGTVAALNDGTGITGVAPGAKVLPVRVADSSGFAWDSATADGIQYAVKRGVQVMNISLAGTYDPVVATMVKYAQGRGILVVAAAGNERDQGNPVRYPGAYPGVLAVGATDEHGGPTYFSEAQPYVRISAPGWDITSAFPVGSTAPSGLCINSGTSMASPHVAGAAALLRQTSGGRVYGALAGAFLTGTTKASGVAGYDTATGFGVVNPPAALAAVRCWTARRCAVPLPNVRDNPAQRWVQRAHIQLTGHGPETRALLNWPAAVRNGSRSGSQLAAPLTRTTGYRQRAAAASLRVAVGRSGPAASVNHYAAQLAAGVTQQRLLSTLVASREAYRRAGGTNTAWVRYAFRTVMGGEPSPASLRLHTSQLARGVSRFTIASRLVSSDPGLSGIVNRQYQQYLGHHASPVVRSYWVGRLRSGMPVSALAANLTGSAEYRAHS